MVDVGWPCVILVWEWFDQGGADLSVKSAQCLDALIVAHDNTLTDTEPTVLLYLLKDPNMNKTSKIQKTRNANSSEGRK